MFRRAIVQGTYEGKPETFYFLEVKEDAWVGTNRLAENREESEWLAAESGHFKNGVIEVKTLMMTMNERFIRQNNDDVEILDPA